MHARSGRCADPRGARGSRRRRGRGTRANSERERDPRPQAAGPRCSGSRSESPSPRPRRSRRTRRPRCAPRRASRCNCRQARRRRRRGRIVTLPGVRRRRVGLPGRPSLRAEGAVSLSKPPASVFVGVTGASGAPYAVRLVRALADAGCELSLCLSDAGVAVVAHELELGVSGRADVTAAFLAAAGAEARVYGPMSSARRPRAGATSPTRPASVPVRCRPWRTSRSARRARSSTGSATSPSKRAGRSCWCRARRRCPRSTSRACSRRVAPAPSSWRPCPASTPCRARSTMSIDFVVGKVLAALGFEQRLSPRCGELARPAGVDEPAATPQPRPRAYRGDVRPHRASLRPHEPADDRGPRPPLAGGGGRRRRAAARGAAARRLLRHRRPLAGPGAGVSGQRRDRSRFLRRHAGPRPAQGRPGRRARRLRARRPAGAALRRRQLRRGHGGLGRAQRRRPRARLRRDGARGGAGRDASCASKPPRRRASWGGAFMPSG